jgi:transposase InsO family protein
VPGGPWEDISADLISPLPESKGHNAILAIIDQFSKMIRLIPTTMEITALRLAELYRDNIWKMHRLPHRITSDRGPQFAAELMKSLCAMLGTKQNLSTVYHPQTDGHVE